MISECDPLPELKSMNEHTIRPIAYIRTDFKEKFGIPRQSSLVLDLFGTIVFEEPYADPAAIRGIEEYSHLWIIWGFSENFDKEGTCPDPGKSANAKTKPAPVLTVCPPRLGGREKRGVFATRSPFRPNGLGLSCVKLEQVIADGSRIKGLLVSGVDMLDGTPVYDIKPYIPYADSFPEAEGGFGQKQADFKVKVEFPQELLQKLPEEKRTAALHVLEQDPRAAYNKNPGYVYGLSFAGYDIRFTAEEDRITVRDVLDQTAEGFENVK